MGDLVSLQATQSGIGNANCWEVYSCRESLPLGTSKRDCSLGPGKIREDFVKLLKPVGKSLEPSLVD